MVKVENLTIRNLQTGKNREVIKITYQEKGKPLHATEIEYKTIGNKIMIL